MTLIADFLLAAGAFGVALYCIVLSRRLRRFATLEGGMGGAIAVLSAQVDDMTRALERARTTAGDSVQSLEALTVRAEAVAARLELILAAMHEMPEAPRAQKPGSAGSARGPRAIRRRRAAMEGEGAQ